MPYSVLAVIWLQLITVAGQLTGFGYPLVPGFSNRAFQPSRGKIFAVIVLLLKFKV